MVDHFDEFLQSILQLASLGIRVYPVHSVSADGYCTCGKPDCDSIAKHPLTAHGFHDASSDPEVIRRWFNETQGLCNWGLRTGDGIGVVDIDPRHGGDDSWLLELLLNRQCDKALVDNNNAIVRTGGGGEHRYFAVPEGLHLPSHDGFLSGLDWKSIGGAVIIPPSLHRSGQRYTWEVPLALPLSPMPECLIEAVKKKPKHHAQPLADSNTSSMMLTVELDLASHPGCGEGKRNSELCRLTGKHFARGEEFSRVWDLAQSWNRRCTPPEAENKVWDTVSRIWHKHQNSQTNPSPSSLKAAPEASPEVSLKASPEAWVSPLIKKIPPHNAGGIGEQGNSLNNAHGLIKKIPPIPPIPPHFAGGILPEVELSHKPQPESEQSSGGLSVEADALHGLSGEIVRAVEPETEADPWAILLSLLVAFGNAIGSGPYFTVGTEEHGANLFAVNVGDTASGKGQAWSIPKWLMQQADASWSTNCIAYGLSSGEGLVERLKDAEQVAQADAEGNITGFAAQGGVEDKRLLCLETEFARPIVSMRREGNTLSMILRNAWDRQCLEVLTRGKSKLKASESHISILAHITPEELAQCFSKGTEVVNGFANRFLWAKVQRQRVLPHGGKPQEALKPFVGRLASALAKAKGIKEVKRSAEADKLWEEVYAGLSESRAGAFGRATERARPQVVRLALLYALADGSSIVEVDHLKAGLAVWRYCEASAKAIFTNRQPPSSSSSEPEPLHNRLLSAILQAQAQGLSRTELWDHVTHKTKAEEMDNALAWLEEKQLVTCCNGRYLSHKPEAVIVIEPEPEAVIVMERGNGGIGELGNNLNKEIPPQEAGELGEEGNFLNKKVPPFPSSPTPMQEPMPLLDLVNEVKAIGGRFKREGEGLSVEAPSSVPQAILDAVAFHEAELQALLS